MLNRAPTLHRLGIQAFQPVLVEGKAIRIHPLVCRAFNADFDGDQMAVHLPLLPGAQLEAHLLMMATTNIFSPSDGSPIVTPSQDIVLGLAWVSRERRGVKGEWKDEWTGPGGELLQPGRVYPDIPSVIMAHAMGEAEVHARIKLSHKGNIVDTTVGRVLLCDALPECIEITDVNRAHDQGSIGQVIARCYQKHGHAKTIELLDALKSAGFRFATRSGLSVAIGDMIIPEEKQQLIDKAMGEVRRIDEMYQNGLITEGERYNKIIDEWTTTTEEVAAVMLKRMEEHEQGFTGIYLMYASKARGSKSQIRQLAAMRGLMAKPSGDIIESPITSNFREGLTVVEYFISSHGARKGLADTALKTADAGYLTRRLVDVSQDVIIEELDCGTLSGVWVEALMDGSDIIAPLQERIVGRFPLDDVIIPGRDEPLCTSDQMITEEIADSIVEAGLPGVTIRSVLTCQSKRGVCQACYGMNLATGKNVEMGEAIGIIAAQSIGEPGTQLTMRTFHIGGAASRQVESSEVKMPESGTLEFNNVRTAVNRQDQKVVVNRGGEVRVLDQHGKETHRFAVPTGCALQAADGDKLRKGQVLYTWDPYNVSIMAEQSGTVRLEGMVEGVTVRLDINPDTGLEERVVTEHKHDLHPQITVLGKEGEVLAFATIPADTHVVVQDGQKVKAGDLLAKTPRQFSKTKDITGGLPRVAELFEARQPKDPAVISHIDGLVEIGGATKGMRKVKVLPKVGKERIYTIPPGKHLNVQTGDRVYAGQRLTDGPVIPQDILSVQGEESLRKYLLDEVQQVYRLQGVRTNDKHIEVIIRQMLRKVRIKGDPGDTPFLAHQEVDKIKFAEINEQTIRRGGRPAEAEPVLQGITKAALSTESFIAAASFQQTTRVLTEAALSGKRDELRGLKENVIIGHLIPAGVGHDAYQGSQPQLKDAALADFSDELEIGDTGFESGMHAEAEEETA
jgi:DNA-directed RNA polymerase subunit beta'